MNHKNGQNWGHAPGEKFAVGAVSQTGHFLFLSSLSLPPTWTRRWSAAWLFPSHATANAHFARIQRQHPLESLEIYHNILLATPIGLQWERDWRTMRTRDLPQERL